MRHAETVDRSDDHAFEVTNKVVLAIAAPMTIAYLTTPLLGLVDTAVVGQLNDVAMLGGLAAGAVIFDLAFTSFNFLRAGTTGLIAQAYGARNVAEEQQIFWRASALGILCGLLLVTAAPLISLAGMWFIGASPAVSSAMDTYIRIRLLAAPLSLLNYVILGYLLGKGDARVALGLQVLINVFNICLSVWWGLYLNLGVAGVAWAAVAAETIAAILGIGIVLSGFGRIIPISLRMLLGPPAVKRLMVFNRDILIRTFVLMGAFALFARQGARLGTVEIAANAILMHFLIIVSFFLDGFAAAVEQLAGRAVGARYLPAFDKAVKLTTVWGGVLAAVFGVVAVVWGTELISLFTTSKEVREEATRYLPLAAATGLTGVLAFQMDGIYLGATWSSTLRNMMLFSFVVYIAALFVLGHYLANYGLWLALHIFLIVRGVSLMLALPRLRTATFGKI
ncbi:MATE family efflux transporter [Phyllobacterium sp. 0TCS1.6C]|uniref:MATE family efflux transporter n=1 Tax=unclassified Phyllobacterium TaxID=2638441 RepID=UPI0022648AFD|nr:MULTISPECIES: MATE family efflux transporter [unclassified Phyllobacterium]MCX8278984.1 MATE family efflux transporter [Phyllobacterium sp. 0TCS1.6C]MCX8293768.1 MATE family efflux transporter [Phyllobacterium sp. 0TCS1.6A]